MLGTYNKSGSVSIKLDTRLEWNYECPIILTSRPCPLPIITLFDPTYDLMHYKLEGLKVIWRDAPESVN